MRALFSLFTSHLSWFFRCAFPVVLSLYPALSFSRGEGGTAGNLCTTKVTAPVQTMTGGVINLKILLVQFSDVRCTAAPDGVSPRYTCSDFENLLGSEGIYVSPGMYSPDGDELFGSMNDYFLNMSGGRISLHAYVINRRDSLSGKPAWITLENSKEYYQAAGIDIFHDALDAADHAGLDVSVSGDTHLAIIYAGNTCFLNGGLNPKAWGYTYIMSEVQGKPYNAENPDARFARIGIHCHEFAHTIDVGHTTGGRADLMYGGTANGSVGGNCPAPLNAIARVRLGWARAIPVESVDGKEVDVPYSLGDPTVYVMRNGLGDQFYIENRRFDQTMRIGSAVVPDYNNVKFFPPAWPHGIITQGIFVWRVNTTGDVLDPGYSSEGLVYASGRYGRSYPEDEMTDTDDGVPFPGVSNTRLLTPWSDPRNPYIREPDFFGGSPPHYTLFVPNTKGGTNCGMEVVSENRAGGTFRVIFHTSNPPNPALARLPNPDSLGYHAGRRSVIAGTAGTMHQVMELGGEILYRRSADSGRSWTASSVVSQGNGGNSAPCITRAGSTLLIAWQMDAYDAADSGRVILLTRSTDAGLTWSAYASAGWSYRCGDPGAYPSITGGNDGSAILVYRAEGTTLWSEISHDAGVSWGGASPVPVGTIGWTTPTLAFDDSAREAVMAYSAGDVAGVGSVMCIRYAFSTCSWGSPCSVSGILTQEYTGLKNPDIIAGSHCSPTRRDVVWDATDAYQGGIPVILSRRVDMPLAGNSFTVVRGSSQDDFSSAKCDPPGLTGGPAWSSSRVLTIADSAASSWISFEIGRTRILHRDGTADTAQFAAAFSDTALLCVRDVLKCGESTPLSAGSNGDTVEVAASVYGFDDGKILAGGRVGLEVMRPGSDTAMARFTVQSSASIPGGRRVLTLYAVPVSSLPLAGNERKVVIRPFLTCPEGDERIGVSLAQVYSPKGETPSGRIITGVAGTESPGRSADRFVLEQNFPNPFNPSTTIRYGIPERMQVNLSIFNALGQRVASLVNGVQERGSHEVRFEAGNIASGTYFCRIQAGAYTRTNKLLLIR